MIATAVTDHQRWTGRRWSGRSCPGRAHFRTLWRLGHRCDPGGASATAAGGGRWPGAEPARSPLTRTRAAAPYGLACWPFGG